MDVVYIILIIKTCRIPNELDRLDDAFEEQIISILNEPLVKSWVKCFPSILNLSLKSSRSIASTVPYS